MAPSDGYMKNGVGVVASGSTLITQLVASMGTGGAPSTTAGS